MTLSKAMQEYLRFHVLQKGGSPASVEQYDRTYRSFLSYVLTHGGKDEPAARTTSKAKRTRKPAAKAMTAKAAPGSSAKPSANSKDAKSSTPVAGSQATAGAQPES